MAAVMSMTPLHLQLLTEGPLADMPSGHAHAASTDVLVLPAESDGADDRVLVQGVPDTMMGVAGAVGAGFSRLVMSGVGYQGLNLAAAAVAAAVNAAALGAAARGRRLQMAA
jgi:hypothetical protein